MFLFFFSFSLSLNFTGDIVHLTDLPPNDGTGYFVMIHKDGCQHCVRLAPTFSKASKLGEGLAVWAELNCAENETACRSIQIDAVPKLYYFRDGMIHKYEGMQLSRLMVDWVSQFSNDTATVIDALNYTEGQFEKEALLFTNKEVIPKIWAGIERSYNNSDVKFFVSRDKELLDKIGGQNFPGVYVKKGAEVKEFTEKLQIHEVVHFMKEFFGDEIKSDDEL